MKCCECKYHKEWITCDEFGNACLKFGFEYYSEYYESECPYVDNEYNLTNDGKELEKIL